MESGDETRLGVTKDPGAPNSARTFTKSSEQQSPLPTRSSKRRRKTQKKKARLERGHGSDSKAEEGLLAHLLIRSSVGPGHRDSLTHRVLAVGRALGERSGPGFGGMFWAGLNRRHGFGVK